MYPVPIPLRTLAAFLFSGLLHELAISLPVRAVSACRCSTSRSTARSC
jgi:hypothetical protein